MGNRNQPIDPVSMSCGRPLDLSSQPDPAERAELDSVVQSLAKWPRLSHLLRYMGEKLFSGQSDQITEYNIATEVLGRSKSVFNAAEDAIARVETHRLRKRLVAFYESEGREHLIHVVLPAGSYVPVFVNNSDAVPIAGSQVPVASSESLSSKPGTHLYKEVKQPFLRVTRHPKYWMIGAGLITALGAYLYLNAVLSRVGATHGHSAAAAPVSQPLAVETFSSGIRLLAGYSGPPRTDSAGAVWSPDQYFTGGSSWQRGQEFLSRTSDPFIFEHSRTGDFSYRIPLKPGTYELHLLFSTPVRSNDTTASFNGWLNDQQLFTGFDINSDAMGENIADERVFRGVSPDKDGVLRLGFTGGNGAPSLNAIEILPGTPDAQLPIRLVMQTTPYTDRKGQFWHPDTYFMHGRLAPQTHPLLDSPEPDLFSGERFGHFSYAIPVDTRDRYRLVLHFAELYFGPGSPGNGGVGSRLFKVMCNGETLLDNFDIFKEAGSLHELSKTFRHLKPTPQGKLNLTFEPIANNATISGIEVLDEPH